MEEMFTLLETFSIPSEAYIVQGKLEAEGIDTALRDNHIVEANPLYSTAVGGVKLYVRTEQREHAQQVYSSISAVSLGENGEPLQCANCSGKNVTMMTSVKDDSSKLGFVVTLLLGALPFIKYRYRCQDCGFEFKADK